MGQLTSKLYSLKEAALAKNPCATCVPAACFKESQTLQLKHASSRFIRAGTAATPRIDISSVPNPVLELDFPDPGLIKIGDTYYAFATNSQSAHVPAARSQDLIHWEMLPDALPVLPVWAAQNFRWTWAPAVTATPEGYAMFFTTRCRRKATQCIGIAMSDKPEGPYEPLNAKPALCNVEIGGSIDPSVFVDDDGTRYMLWKTDGNAIGVPTWICIQRIASDGLTLVGSPVRLFANDLPWEGKLIEGPTLWKHNGKYYLFYSANHFTGSRYAIGYAVADDVWGPYKKSAAPLWSTNRARAVVGPGGQDIVSGLDGVPWILYHAWTPGGHRGLNAGRLSWQEHRPRPERRSKGIKYELDPDLDSADASSALV